MDLTTLLHNTGDLTVDMTSSDQLPFVYIVDDDVSIHASIRLLLSTCKLNARCFSSGLEFLSGTTPEAVGCLLLDVRMPNMSGLELQNVMRTCGYDLPVILLTGYADVGMAVRAMKSGALDLVQKPVNGQHLLDLVQAALRISSGESEKRSRLRRWKTQMTSLTNREREILDHIVCGKANKVIALDLGISVRTVEVHRARLMTKLKVGSLAELIKKMAEMERSGMGP